MNEIVLLNLRISMWGVNRVLPENEYEVDADRAMVRASKKILECPEYEFLLQLKRSIHRRLKALALSRRWMLRLSWSRNSYSGHSRIFFEARTMARSASTSYSFSGSTRLTPHMLIRRFNSTISFMAHSFQEMGDGRVGGAAIALVSVN